MNAGTGAHDDDGHVALRVIQARVDGELSGPDAARVDAHCDACDSCAAHRDELMAVQLTLRADADATPLRPVWPHVRDRLRGQPRFGLSFAFGAGLAVTAGLLLGVVLGASVAPSESTDVATTAVQSTSDAGLSSWISLGSSLPDLYGLSSEVSGS